VREMSHQEALSNESARNTIKDSLNRTKSYYSSLNNKLQMSQATSSPDLLQAQDRELLRQVVITLTITLNTLTHFLA